MNPLYRDDGRLRAGWRVLLGVVVAFAANVIAASVAASLPELGGFRAELVYRPLTMILLIAGFSLLEITADQVDENPLAAQGLGRRHWLRDAALGMAIGAGLIAIDVGAMAATGQVSFQVTASPDIARRLVTVLVILAAAAMTEELMFRGYPFQRLVEALGAVPAILVLSAMFGALHGHNPHVSRLAILNTILVGVLLAVAYLRTRALWLPWGIHFAWNTTLGVAFGLPVSGLSMFAVVVKGVALGPVWLTGGEYGVEGSLTATIVILLGFPAVLKLTRAGRADLAQVGSTDGTSGGLGHPTAQGSVRQGGEHAQGN